MRIQVIKSVVQAAGLLPWLTQTPYLLRTWRESPPDRWDWLWLLLAGGLAVAGHGFLQRQAGRTNGWFVIPAAAGLLLYGGGLAKEIHLLTLGGALIFGWSVGGMLWGRRVAMATLPLAGLVLLASPGTNYWFGFFLACEGWIPNLAWGVVGVAWFVIAWRCGKLPPWRYLVFGAGLLLLLGLYGGSSGGHRFFSPFLPDLEQFQQGRWIGREIAPDANDRRFFGASRVRRYFFSGDHRSISVLKVDQFADIHQIHPAGYCLKAAGRHLVHDRLRTIRLPDGDRELNEILTDSGTGRFTLLWSWYSNPEYSTGDFLRFRRHYEPKAQWSAWQLGTSGKWGEEAEAAAELTRLLRAGHTAVARP